MLPLVSAVHGQGPSHWRVRVSLLFHIFSTHNPIAAYAPVTGQCVKVNGSMAQMCVAARSPKLIVVTWDCICLRALVGDSISTVERRGRLIDSSMHAGVTRAPWCAGCSSSSLFRPSGYWSRYSPSALAQPSSLPAPSAQVWHLRSYLRKGDTSNPSPAFRQDWLCLLIALQVVTEVMLQLADCIGCGPLPLDCFLACELKSCTALY